MPLYAFCRSCNTNVWVSESGCPTHGAGPVGQLHVVDDTQKQTVHLYCHNCRKPQTLPEAASSSRCSACGSSRTFVRCRKCGAVAFVPDKPSGGVPGSFTCPDCDRPSRPKDSLSTAGEYAASLDQRGVARPTGAAAGSDRVLRMTLLAVGGADLEPGLVTELQFEAGGFQIKQGDVVLEYTYEELLRLEVGGRGVRETSLGLIGGGFGVEGAVKGIVAASVINALTTQSSVDTNLQVGAMDAEFLLHTSSLTPEQLRGALADTFVKFHRIEHERQSRSASQVGESAVAQVERAHALLAAGAITQEEYENLKKGILG